jgi:LacI family transcriptional regulator
LHAILRDFVRVARKTTVYDIAERLNISPSTVSRVLNNSALISEEKRRLILATAEEMGYEKRTIRRHGGRAILNIALFLPYATLTYRHLFYDPAELIAGIEEGFGAVRGHIVTSLNTEGNMLFSHKKYGDIDGCIFGFTEPDARLWEEITRRGIPSVLLNRIDSERNYITCNNSLGMETLLERVLRCRGEARPAYLSFLPATPVNGYREEGFRAACRAHEIVCDESAVWRISRLEEIDAALVRSIVEAGHDTVMCFNDFVAVTFLNAAFVAGFSVPGDFALTGFDNSPVRQLSVRKVDSINLSTYRLGRMAGGWLKRRIIDRSDEEISMSIEGELVEGDTVCTDVYAETRERR